MPAAFEYDLAKFLPFRDKAVCERVRRIRKEDICKHPSANFKIRIIEDETAFQFGFVLDIVAGIKRSLEEGRDKYVMILPAPNPQYAFVAESSGHDDPQECDPTPVQLPAADAAHGPADAGFGRG